MGIGRLFSFNEYDRTTERFAKALPEIAETLKKMLGRMESDGNAVPPLWVFRNNLRSVQYNHGVLPSDQFGREDAQPRRQSGDQGVAVFGGASVRPETPEQVLVRVGAELQQAKDQIEAYKRLRYFVAQVEAIDGAYGANKPRQAMRMIKEVADSLLEV